MDTTDTTEAPEAEPAVRKPTVAEALERLREIREHLAPVDDLNLERRWLLVLLADSHGTGLDTIAEADGADKGAVRVAISKTRRAPVPTPARYLAAT